RNGSCAALLHYHIVDVPPVSIIALKVVVDKADLDALANIGPEIDSGAEPGLDTSICRTFPAFLPVAPAGHALVVEGGAWQDALTIGWAIAGVFRRDLYLNVRL